jgi:hypothetical protein
VSCFLDPWFLRVRLEVVVGITLKSMWSVNIDKHFSMQTHFLDCGQDSKVPPLLLRPLQGGHPR